MTRVKPTTEELLAEIQFWIGMYGKALSALDAIALDDEFELGRNYPEIIAESLRAEHQRWMDQARQRLSTSGTLNMER